MKYYNLPRYIYIYISHCNILELFRLAGCRVAPVRGKPIAGLISQCVPVISTHTFPWRMISHVFFDFPMWGSWRVTESPKPLHSQSWNLNIHVYIVYRCLYCCNLDLDFCFTILQSWWLATSHLDNLPSQVLKSVEEAETTLQSSTGKFSEAKAPEFRWKIGIFTKGTHPLVPSGYD